MPSHRRVHVSLSIAAAFVMAACGGGSTATTGPGGGATNPPATNAPGVATAGPVATQAGGGPGGGSGYNGKVCDLLTAAEIQSVMHVTGVTGQETPLVSQSGACLYMTGDGDIAAALSFTGGDPGGMVWQTWKAQAEAVQISVPGGEAIFLPSAETTFLYKNGSLIGIQAGTGSASADERKGWETELAKLMAARR